MAILRYSDDRSVFSFRVMPLGCVFVAGLLLGLAATGLCAEDPLASGKRSEHQPNIVLIVADDK